MRDIAPGWKAEIDRGPDWIFVRLHGPPQTIEEIGLADAVWELMQNEFANRLVLELDELKLLPSHLIGQLVVLHKRIESNGGLLRVCGMSDDTEEVLRVNRLTDFLPRYDSREEAVMGRRPVLPR